MLKLYFGSVFSTISTVLATVFAVFLALVAPRRDSITHWGSLVLVLFFLGLAMSIMSGMRDGIGTATPLIPNKHWLVTVLCVLGGLAFLTGGAALFVHNQAFWQVSFYVLSAITILKTILKTILMEVFRIAQYVRR